jgi:ribosomal protein S27AE
MEDEILSINPSRNVATDPYVLRLPDGHVRVTATSIAFPETCPRCGSSPANTHVILRFTNENNLSIKLPFCRRCGWILNITQYLFAAVFFASVFLVLPRLRFPAFPWLSKAPSFIGPLAIFWICGWTAQQTLQMFFKPGVKVVAAKKDFIELAFDDQMYAENFVGLNR